jgi:type I restriction enzyme S subunit
MKSADLGELPEGWVWSALEDLVQDSLNGYGKRKQDIGEPTIVLRLADILEQEVSLESPRRVNSTSGQVEKYRLKPGDLLTIRVNGSPDLVGRLIHFPGAEEPVLFCDHFIRLRMVPGVIPKFVRLYGDASAFRWHVQITKVSSAGQNTISQEALEHAQIPLPPLAEQQRIVTKVETLLARVNAARHRLAKVTAILKRLRQSVLAAACSGRLTADWREKMINLEPAAELLNRIVNRRAAKQPDGKAAQSRVVSEAETELPALWCWAKFEEITQNFDGKRIPVKADDRAKRRGEYPYYGASGIIDSIDDYLFDGHFLLIGKDGANLLARSTPIAFRAKGRFWVNNHAHVVQALGGIPLQYLEAFINGIDLQEYVTGSAQPKLTQAALNGIPVPLPPLPEQHEVIRRVEALFRLADAIENRVAAATARAEKLTQAILAKAFRGELVPTEAGLARREGRNYEPASVLLERIRAERAQPQERQKRRPRRIR